LRHNIPVGCISLVGPIKLGIVGCNGLIGLIGPIGRIGVVGYIGHNGLVGVISLSLFILAGIVGLIGFGLVSLIGLDDLSITSLFGLSASSAHHLIIFFILIGLSIHRPFKQGAHRVAIKLTSVTEIANAASNYFFHRLVASHAFAHEGEDVVVARSREEKYVAVDRLFWQILPR
jgi:hypothetical protein